MILSGLFLFFFSFL
uniref:Uncharacterized protein n=1 Tax=Rhizophora mucronata TaxID=61149 RepID=A0A2P2NXS3_RHIMU